MAFLLSSERPAGFGLPFHPLAIFRRVLDAARTERQRRTALISLLELDDFRLDDLGLNRQDILEASLAQREAGRLLSRRRAERARNWFGAC